MYLNEYLSQNKCEFIFYYLYTKYSMLFFIQRSETEMRISQYNIVKDWILFFWKRFVGSLKSWYKGAHIKALYWLHFTIDIPVWIVVGFNWFLYIYTELIVVNWIFTERRCSNWIRILAPGAPLLVPKECSAENNSVTIAWKPPLGCGQRGPSIEGYLLELDDGCDGEFRVSSK